MGLFDFFKPKPPTPATDAFVSALKDAAGQRGFQEEGGIYTSKETFVSTDTFAKSLEIIKSRITPEVYDKAMSELRDPATQTTAFEKISGGKHINFDSNSRNPEQKALHESVNGLFGAMGFDARQAEALTANALQYERMENGSEKAIKNESAILSGKEPQEPKLSGGEADLTLSGNAGDGLRMKNTVPRTNQQPQVTQANTSLVDSVRKKGSDGSPSLVGQYLNDNAVTQGKAGAGGTVDIANFGDSYAYVKATSQGKEGQLSQDFASTRDNFNKGYETYAKSQSNPASREEYASAITQVYEKGFGARTNSDGTQINADTQTEMNRINKEIGKLGTTNVLPTNREVNENRDNAKQYLETIKPLETKQNEQKSNAIPQDVLDQARSVALNGAAYKQDNSNLPEMPQVAQRGGAQIQTTQIG